MNAKISNLAGLLEKIESEESSVLKDLDEDLEQECRGLRSCKLSDTPLHVEYRKHGKKVVFVMTSRKDE